MFARSLHFQNLVLAFSIASWASAQTLNPARIDALAAEALKAWQAPGCAVAIIQGDQILLQKGYGVKELGKTDPVTAKTVFAIGSTTKAFTTTLLAMLQDDGLLQWDDPVRKHLPNFQLSDPSANELVTLRDLVSHRTGLSRNDILWYGSPWSRGEILERIGRVRLTKPFRSAWQYQNMMFLASGEAAGAAAHSTWDQLIETRILAPLNMRSTSVTTWDIPGSPDHATPHVKRDGVTQTTNWRNLDNIGPAGSINSNLEDLTEWLRFQMNDGVTSSGKRVVSERSLHETHLPQMAMRHEDWGRNTNDETNQMTYGLGWFLQDYRGRHVVNHGGAIDGFRANFTFLPKERIGIIVLSNLGDDNLPEALRWSILDHLLGAPPKDWNQYLIAIGERERASGARARTERDRNRKRDTKPSRELEAYTGFYRQSAYGTTRITLDAGKLFLEWSTFHVPLEHYHFDTFSIADSRIAGLVTFRLDASGKPAGLDFLGLGFERAPSPYDPSKIAVQILDHLKLEPGENVIIRYDPSYMADLTDPLASAIEKSGAKVAATLHSVSSTASAGDRELAATKLRAGLANATVYLWMPLRDSQVVTDAENRQLVAWLKQGGARREIHFHWNGGSVLADGLPTDHTARFDGIYANALDLDYQGVSAAQDQTALALRSGLVRVRTPAGTDLTFRVGGRPFNKQDGDASPARMKSARVQVDREIELPAGVLRVAPLEETANGVIVVPEARFGNQKTRGLRLTIVSGQVRELSATANETAARAAILGVRDGSGSFREFGLGFNPKLTIQPNSPVLPYFAYGSGMVRLSLGDNEELGGAVRGGGRRWFFFPDATVEANGVMLVDHGRLITP